MLWFAIVAALLAAQDRVVDQATLVIREDGREVGREAYTIRRGRLEDGSAGYLLSASASIGSARVTVGMEIGDDWGTRSFSVESQETQSRAGTRILGRATRDRFILRTVSPTGERAREFPLAPALLFLSDSSFAFYALVGPRLERGEARFAALSTRGGPRLATGVADRGLARTELDGVPTTLRHLELRVGDESRHLWLFPDGRLAKVEVPARNIVVERTPAGS